LLHQHGRLLLLLLHVPQLDWVQLLLLPRKLMRSQHVKFLLLLLLLLGRLWLCQVLVVVEVY
jgi:hypothetical protein